jgi:hypothetical protein
MNTILSVHFTASDVKDAHSKATEIWRKFVADDEASLPWDAAVKATAEVETITGDDGDLRTDIVGWHFEMTARVQQDEAA